MGASLSSDVHQFKIDEIFEDIPQCVGVLTPNYKIKSKAESLNLNYFISKLKKASLHPAALLHTSIGGATLQQVGKIDTQCFLEILITIILFPRAVKSDKKY